MPVDVSDASLDNGTEDIAETSVENTADSTNDSHGSGEHQRSVVERLKKKRVRNGVTQYLVKWEGYNNRYNSWRDLCDLQCDELIADFESQSALNAVAVPGESASHGVLQTDTEVDRQSAVVFGEDDCDAVIAVRRLMNRQGLEGTVADYLPGYKNEVRNVIRRRLVLQDSETAEQVRRDHQVGRLRMLLELKRNLRKKGRMIVQGFREPEEWDDGSNVSPVAFVDSIRMLFFMAGLASDVISTNDVAVAFLQAVGFAHDGARYVSYKAYREAAEHLFRLHGPLYGQRCASKKFYLTMAGWLSDQGFEQAKNEPCLFVHKMTGMRVIIVVDDLLVRGPADQTDLFHDALETRFECSPGSRKLLTPECDIDYCGMNMSVTITDGVKEYSIDQTEGMQKLLDEFGMSEGSVNSSPMPNSDLLLSDSTVLDESESAWCKALLGKLHYFCRTTRWDIALPVSLHSQFNRHPTVGLRLALLYLGGYLRGTVGFRLSGIRPESVDVMHYFTDSNFYGSARAQTGVMILLNGVPVHWRSNRQPVTADSPACAEIYALKEGVKDGRLFNWVAEEMGMNVSWPFVVQVDIKQAISFQQDTCINSKIRGSIDMRLEWVDELRDLSIVNIEHVSGEDNLADILTKCLKGPKHASMVNKTVNFQKSEILGGHVYLSICH